MKPDIVPQWDLSNIFPSLESDQFEVAISKAKILVDELDNFFSEKVISTSLDTPITELADVVGKLIDSLNIIYEQAGTIRAYIYSFISTNSRDNNAAKKLSEFDQLGLRIQILGSRFQSWIGKLSPVLGSIIEANQQAKSHSYGLIVAAEQSKFMMSESEEILAAELNISGAGAWSKLQGTLTSQLSVDFEVDGQIQKLPMPALINMHSHPNESVRQRAYEAEMRAWKTIEEPLAAALNGVKGSANTINKRRGRKNALHQSIDMAHIDQQTLDAMLLAMEESFPVFHRYFKTKAKRLGKNKLAWWDLFAPVGEANKSFTWQEVREFILINFNKFSPELAAFAKRAFDNNWIDGEQRDGKRGGAFCMEIPIVKESRILCNFDGSLDQVCTIAHELGHAFHNECAFKAGKTSLQQDTPMTLAETASIMCETIIMEAILDQTAIPDEKLAILETRLIGDAQVIVDIYSRYLFEKEVFERRALSELSANDFNDIMERAQKISYGDGLDEKYMMKYMWTWKPHYYSASLSFYNYPYAFGLLFSTGLYAIYQNRGAAFVPDYLNLLANTGEASAADLALRFGINIHEKKFWADSLRIIAKKIEQYEKL